MDKVWICKECEDGNGVACELVLLGDFPATPTDCPITEHGHAEANWQSKEDKGCAECNKLSGVDICITHQLEQADADVLKAMNRVEEIKQKIAKEKKSVSTDRADIR